MAGKKTTKKKDPQKKAQKADGKLGGYSGGAVSAINKRKAAMKKQMDAISGKKKK